MRYAAPRRAALATLACLVLTAVAAAVAPTADAQAADEARARLVVTDLTGVAGPGVDPDAPADEPPDLDVRVLVENTGEVDLDALQVVVEVYPAVGGARSVLQETLDTQTVRGVQRALQPVDVRDGGTLAPGDISGVSVTIDGGAIGWQGTNDVYPVQISVLRGSQVLDRVVTASVHLVDRPDQRLQTTLVWPFEGPNRRTATGRYVEALPDDLRPGGRIDVLLSALEQRPDAPVLIAPEAALVEELADRANGFALVDGTEVGADGEPALQAADLLTRLRSLVAATRLDPVIGPYGRADVAALGQGSLAVAAMADVAVNAARNRIQGLLDRAPDLEVFLATTPMTTEALSVLDADHLLLPWDQVVGPDLATHPNLPHARRELLGIRGQGVARRATVADPHVAGILRQPRLDEGTTIVRQRLVAETALLYLMEPSRADRALLVLPPAGWDPHDAVPRAVMDAFLDSPWIELGRPTPSEPSDDAVLHPRPDALPAAVAQDVEGAQQRLEALRAAMPDGTPGLGTQTVSDLEDALLRALTPEALADGGLAARDAIGDVRDVAEGAFGTVRLVGNSRVTLTSDRGEVPITIERTEGAEIEVMVEVRSSNALRWTDDVRTQTLTLPADASRTVAFSTRALSRGLFPVTVSVWDPTRDKLLDETRLSVRSTAISRTALMVIGGVVLVLLLGGLRRRRTPKLEVVR